MKLAVMTALDRLSPAGQAAVLRGVPPHHLKAWRAHWADWAHRGQLAPPGAWRTWLLMAGRGFGKTRAGSAWVHGLAADGDARIALVAATIDEARRVMVEGPSGLLATAPEDPPVFHPVTRKLVFTSGAEATLFSGANPESLRGPEHGYAWCDELAKWRHPVETWDMLQLGLRIGEAARSLVTTTPRAGSAALRAMLADVDTVVTGGPSRRNPHVAAAWQRAMAARFGGTRLGRQELDGVLLDDVDGALWPHDLLARSRGVAPERFARVLIGVDPPASAGGVCGIVACGVDATGVTWVLGDHSAGGLSPEGWARRVAGAADAWAADGVVAETNQGGEMVAAVLAAGGVTLPVRAAHARHGKGARAEPVAALFEAGRAQLAGTFAELEAEMAGMTVAGPADGRSPDRVDAMVWAVWALVLAARGMPAVRDLNA